MLRVENTAANRVNQVPIASAITEEDQTCLKRTNANGEILILWFFFAPNRRRGAQEDAGKLFKQKQLSFE